MSTFDGTKEQQMQFYWDQAAKQAKDRLREINPALVEQFDDVQSLVPKVCNTIDGALIAQTKQNLNNLGSVLSPSAIDKLKGWLGDFASTLWKYAPVIDAAVQHHPQYVALVWASIRMILQVKCPQDLCYCVQ